LIFLAGAFDPLPLFRLWSICPPTVRIFPDPCAQQRFLCSLDLIFSGFICILKGQIAFSNPLSNIQDRPMLLECRDITFQYPGAEFPVLLNLSLNLSEPGFHALFGPSGVGKTSLARIITGDIDGYTGTIETQAIRTMLYSYNMERLPGWSSVGRHLDKISPPSCKQRGQDLVEAFGLGDVIDQRFWQLSLGQQNRINLIRYLLQDFQLLIMDESLANVDEMTRERILLKIKEMFPEVIFLYISHNVVEVAKFCRQIFVFRSQPKHPQILCIEGQDHRWGQSLDKKRHELTMLEIMNAA
jgi:ABC-type nitrate/sulfonate/bicarbonate transport system ATPase subunit